MHVHLLSVRAARFARCELNAQGAKVLDVKTLGWCYLFENLILFSATVQRKPEGSRILLSREQSSWMVCVRLDEIWIC